MLRASGCRKVRKNGRRDRWTAKGFATLKIWAIGTTRNEADIIRANVLHHLNQGIDRFLILDNGSVDGTCDVLSELAHSFPVEWKQHIGHFRQRELLTRLARETFVRGADWVMTVDADEFWYAPGSTLRTVLEGSSAGALRVQLVNFVQRREQLSTTRDALLHMTYRPANTVGPIERAVELFEAEQISFVEHRYVPKWISRTCASLEIGWGMHHVHGAREPTQDISEIVCLHAPLRSHQVLESKTDLARSIEDIEDYLGVCWHLRRWRRLAREGRLEAEWQANSYLDGQLHRDGQPYPLVYDSTLRDIVAPYIVPKGREQPLVPVPFHVPEARQSTSSASSTSVRRGGGGHAVWGVSVVRNEVDIVRTNLLYHLALGLERVLVIDNGSTDGTELVLEELSRELPVTWRRIPGPFRQPELTTELAREAFHGGARWVLPIDADEFWYPCNGDNLESILGSTSATALGCQVINFVQSRDQVHRSPDALLHMTMRPQHVVGPVMAARELVDARRFAYVETRYPAKWITSASADLSIAKGNHDIWPPSERAVHSDAVVVLHAPLRAYAILAAQAEHGRRLDEAACPPEASWQQRRWRRLADARRLDLEWLANSYYGRHLDVYGQKHMLVEDLRLRDAVRPWLVGAAGATVDRHGGGHARTLDVGERQAILNRIQPIDGWLEDAAAELLIAVTERALAGRAEPATIVEVGSYCGRSTVLLGSTIQALDARARVFAIDPHRGEIGALDSSFGIEMRRPTFEVFRRNLVEAGLTRTVEPIVRRSYDVEWSRPIHLMFIDGFHDYLSVSQDLALFSDWVVPGGYVAFHDHVAKFPGVMRCVTEALASDRFRKVEQAESLIVLQKQPRSCAD
jgi:glycosyltransferase involved in cell wall biosynthesis